MMNQLSNTPNAATENTAALGGFGLGTSSPSVSLGVSDASYGICMRPWANGPAGRYGPALLAGRPAAQPIHREQLHTTTPISAAVKRGVSGPHPPREPV